MFSKEERQIFRREIAGQVLAFDPLAIKRQIIEAATKLEVDLVADFVLIDTEQSIESGALGRIVKVFREVFGLPPLSKDGKGYLDQDVLSLADEFANYMNDLKKNTEMKRTSQQPTDCQDELTTNLT